MAWRAARHSPVRVEAEARNVVLEPYQPLRDPRDGLLVRRDVQAVVFHRLEGRRGDVLRGLQRADRGHRRLVRDRAGAGVDELVVGERGATGRRR